VVHNCDSGAQRAQLMWTALECRWLVVPLVPVCCFMVHAPLTKPACGADSLDEAAGAQMPVRSVSVVHVCTVCFVEVRFWQHNGWGLPQGVASLTQSTGLRAAGFVMVSRLRTAASLSQGTRQRYNEHHGVMVENLRHAVTAEPLIS
jgi:hypothetical protein